jgi:hypothetical protein
MPFTTIERTENESTADFIRRVWGAVSSVPPESVHRYVDQVQRTIVPQGYLCRYEFANILREMVHDPMAEVYAGWIDDDPARPGLGRNIYYAYDMDGYTNGDFSHLNPFSMADNIPIAAAVYDPRGEKTFGNPTGK